MSLLLNNYRISTLCLNLTVVAEGVETKDQLDYFSKISCDIIQGYYFSRPLEFDKVAKGFEEDNRLVFNR